jgi:hypothetical protein
MIISFFDCICLVLLLFSIFLGLTMPSYIFAIIILLFSIPVCAETQQISTDRKITKISVYADRAIVSLSPSFDLNLSCKQGNSTKVAISISTDNSAILSTALAAAAQSLKVGFGVSGCLSDVAKVYRIDMRY